MFRRGGPLKASNAALANTATQRSFSGKVTLSPSSSAGCPTQDVKLFTDLPI